MYKIRCFLCSQIDVTVAADLLNNDKRVKYKLLCIKCYFLNKKNRILSMILLNKEG